MNVRLIVMNKHGSVLRTLLVTGFLLISGVAAAQEEGASWRRGPEVELYEVVMPDLQCRWGWLAPIAVDLGQVGL